MNILEELGLTKNESLTYETSLQLGDVPIRILQKSLGVHPQIVYRSVESLEKKNLVTIQIRNGKKHVIPSHPKILEQIEKDKLERLKERMPQLLKMIRPMKESLVKTSIGVNAIKAFRRLAISELKRNDTLYIIGGSSDRFYSVLGEDYKDIEEKRINKRIFKKLIAFTSEKERFNKDPHRLFSEFRYFSHFHPTTSSINIFGNNVGIIIWAIDPILIHIKNVDVATSYKHYFDELWTVSHS